MRPFVVTLPAKICAVTTIAEGYAVTTEKGVELVSPDLARIGSIPAPGIRELWGEALRELPDGRFLACSQRSFGGLFVGRRGGVMERIVAEDEYVFPPLATKTGFVAAQWQKAVLWIDEAGQRRHARLPIAPDQAATCCERLVLLHEERLVAVDAGGVEVAARSVPRFSSLLGVVGDCVVIRFNDQTVKLIDAVSLDEIDAIQVAYHYGVSKPILEHNGSPIAVDNTSIWYRGRWKVPVSCGSVVIVVGDWLIVGGGEDGTRIIAVATGAITTVPVKWLRAAAALGDGIVLVGSTAVWWRAGRQLGELEHDSAPNLVCTVPAGAVTADRRELYLWRDGVDGPKLAPVATTIPYDVPVIAQGKRLIVREARKFSLICDLSGQEWPIAADSEWRFPLKPEEARAIVDRLIARDFAGPLPVIADEGHSASTQLIQLPPADVVSLHGRKLFDRSSLTKSQQYAAASTLDSFITELCDALKTRPRVLLAQLHARNLAVKPPRVLASYDYLGWFTTSRHVWVADPCYFNKRTPGKWLSVTLEVREGRWHAFARGEPTEELVVIHDEGFAVEARTDAGSVGVDAGCAGVFDTSCPNIDLDFGVQEGVCFGLGALTHSGIGDGVYTVYTGRLGRDIAKIRIAFDDAAKRDRAIAVATSGRAYSPKQRFALGEAIEHPTFGIGTVTAVQPGKIDVTFPDGARTLVHARS